MKTWKNSLLVGMAFLFCFFGSPMFSLAQVSPPELAVDLNTSMTASGSQVGQVILFQSKLYFSATDGIHGRELWVSDGDTASMVVCPLLNAVT